MYLAQTSQAMPDPATLKLQAAKAMDKDDKKKMGEEKFNTFRRLRKILQGKNNTSKKMAQTIEDVLANRPTEGLVKKESSSSGKSSNVQDKKGDAINQEVADARNGSGSSKSSKSTKTTTNSTESDFKKDGGKDKEDRDKKVGEAINSMKGGNGKVSKKA